MGFSYFRSLTISHTKLGASDLSNFPCLIYISTPMFKDAAHGGHVQSSSGYDICFYSDVNGNTPLSWEVEYYDNVNGTLWAWAKVPTVSHTVDTVVYVYYGDASISTFQSTASAVWDANYSGVWHLANGTVLTAADSTANALNGTLVNAPAAVTGQVDGGAGFTAGSTQAIDLGTPLISGTALTVSQWINAGNSVVGTIVAQWNDQGALDNFILDHNGGSGHARWIVKDSGGTFQTVNGTSNLADSAWHYMVGVWTAGSGNMKVYVDGAQQNTGTAGAASLAAPFSAHFYFGRYIDGAYYTGSLDEVRLSNVVRSADWILTEYNNQSAPATFISVGVEAPVLGKSLISLFGVGS